jgi:LysR family nitrogen assimilation transcriptional regulator
LVTAETLGKLPLVLPSHPHGIRVLVDSLMNAHGLAPAVECEIDSLSTTLQLVEQGVGYTILPYAAVISRITAGQLVAMRLAGRCLVRQLVLATSTQRPTTLATRSLAKAVTQLVRDLVEDGLWMPKDELTSVLKPRVAMPDQARRAAAKVAIA